MRCVFIFIKPKTILYILQACFFTCCNFEVDKQKNPAINETDIISPTSNSKHSLFSEKDNIGSFRNLKLGSDITENVNLELYTKPDLDNYPYDQLPGFKIYTKKSEKLNIGDIKLSQITYFYFNNKLYKIKIFSKHRNYKDLLEVLENKYGVGKENTNVPAYFIYNWENDNSKIHFESDAIEAGFTTIIYKSKDIEALISKELKKAKADIKKLRNQDI